MISTLVGSDRPDKYSYETPHEYLLWWGNLSGKITEIISINRNQMFNLELSFLNGDFPSPIFSDFFKEALFPEKLLFHTSLG